jgi:hypothetical protein
MRKSPGVRSVRQTLNLCIAVFLVLVAIYAVAVAIKMTADRTAARNVFDALIHDICTHPVVGCHVT